MVKMYKDSRGKTWSIIKRPFRCFIVEDGCEPEPFGFCCRAEAVKVLNWRAGEYGWTRIPGNPDSLYEVDEQELADCFANRPESDATNFKVWCPARGERIEDAEDVATFSHSQAAENWADRIDFTSAEFRIVGGSPCIVHVALSDGSDVRRFKVSGEAVREYRAKPLPGPKGEIK